jgi:hypothetical protein
MNWLTDLLAPAPPVEELKEWSKSAPEFLHSYYVTRLDDTVLSDCDPCGLLEDGKCIYLLEDKCMLDGLQQITKGKS